MFSDLPTQQPDNTAAPLTGRSHAARDPQCLAADGVLPRRRPRSHTSRYVYTLLCMFFCAGCSQTYSLTSFCVWRVLGNPRLQYIAYVLLYMPLFMCILIFLMIFMLFFGSFRLLRFLPRFSPPLRIPILFTVSPLPHLLPRQSSPFHPVAAAARMHFTAPVRLLLTFSHQSISPW